jgi:hypothetical protein
MSDQALTITSLPPEATPVHAMVWLDDDRIAVGGIGEDKQSMTPGARIFDVHDAGNRLADKPDDRTADLGTFAFAGPGETALELAAHNETSLIRWRTRDPQG